jgi:hypothetical protein
MVEHGDETQCASQLFASDVGRRTMWTFRSLLIANAIFAAAACFVTTPDNANIVQDLAKLKACNAETCWASCGDGHMRGRLSTGAGDCWLKSVLANTYKRPGNRH